MKKAKFEICPVTEWRVWVKRSDVNGDGFYVSPSFDTRKEAVIKAREWRDDTGEENCVVKVLVTPA